VTSSRIISLGPADSDRLRTFRCAGPDEPWARDVERAIQQGVGTSLAETGYSGIGVEDESALCAVCTWIEADKDRWKMNLLATSLSHRRKGYATDLVIELIGRARRAGVETLHAEVDIDNAPMRHLLADLGAFEQPDYEAARAFLVFRLVP
jgi:GNAT superfamily N-acetyltransferase